MKDIEPLLRSLVRDHGMPLKKLGIGLGVSSSEVLRWNNKEKAKFTFSQIRSLASYLGVSFDELAGRKFDANFIRRRIHEGPLVLPEKYALNAGSRVRTSAHIIDFLKLYYGQKFCDDLLLSMNIHPCYFDNLDNEISFQFFVDLLEKLQHLNYELDQIQSLAHLLPVFLKGSALGEALAKTSSYQELYYVIMENINKFDRNFDYKSQITSRGVLFEARPSDELKSNWPKRNGNLYDLEEIYFYRQGLLSHFPLLQGQQHIGVTPLKALHMGDSLDQYWIEFPEGFMPQNHRIAHCL